MNQLEMAKKAKNYMDKLAQGIDPISGKTLPENDTLNQLPLARCFFYVSQVLGEVIANGGQVGAKKAEPMVDFCLTQQEMEQFSYSSIPLTITQIVDQLNQLHNHQNMKKLSTTMVTNWLVAKGYLEQTETEPGKSKRVPTQAGCEIGLELLLRPSVPRPHSVVLYHPPAQRFVVEHLPEILADYKKKT